MEMRSDETADSARKTTLFCPDCGHQSGYDGDWQQVVRGQTVQYNCPDCRTEITTRPRSVANTPPHAAFWQTWTRGLQSWWKSILPS